MLHLALPSLSTIVTLAWRLWASVTMHWYSPRSEASGLCTCNVDLSMLAATLQQRSQQGIFSFVRIQCYVDNIKAWGRRGSHLLPIPNMHTYFVCNRYAFGVWAQNFMCRSMPALMCAACIYSAHNPAHTPRSEAFACILHTSVWIWSSHAQSCAHLSPPESLAHILHIA